MCDTNLELSRAATNKKADSLLQSKTLKPKRCWLSPQRNPAAGDRNLEDKCNYESFKLLLSIKMFFLFPFRDNQVLLNLWKLRHSTVLPPHLWTWSALRGGPCWLQNNASLYCHCLFRTESWKGREEKTENRWTK